MAMHNLSPNGGVWDFAFRQSEDDPKLWTLAFHDPTTFNQTSTFPLIFRDRDHALSWFAEHVSPTSAKTTNTSIDGQTPAPQVGQLVNDLHFACCDDEEHSPWFYGAYSICNFTSIDVDEFDAGLLPLRRVPGFETSDAMHVFVVHGDMQHLKSDAALVPTDGRPHVNGQWGWLWATPGLSPELPDWVAERVRANRTAVIDAEAMQVVLADIALDGKASADQAVVWLRGGLLAALNAYGENLRDPMPDRRRPVLVVPMLGTKGANLGGRRGEVARELLSTLQQFASTSPVAHRFDVVLVMRTASDYAAMQTLRREMHQDLPYQRWIQPTLRAAASGQLGVLFGAGASMALGLPRWDELLRLLAQDLGLGALASGLLRLDPVDAASLLRERAGSNEAFTAALRKRLSSDQASLMHTLLANLKPGVAITTNYDRGYEVAVEGMQDQCAVLPWRQPMRPDQPRLLKLHGDLNFGSVVLTRDDFVTMHAHRRPLGSMLQERMLVGHLLVVGSSMSDSTLVQAAEEVASLVRTVKQDDFGDAGGSSGTVLLTVDDPSRRMLLRRSFTVAFGTDDGANIGDGVRNVEILLDFIAMHAERRLGYLMDPAYADLVTHPHLQLLVHQLQVLDEMLQVPPDTSSSALAELHIALRTMFRDL